MAANLQLKLLRDTFTPVHTLGKLLVNGVMAWWTVEDTVREDPIPATPENEAKVQDKTAIPEGEYTVKLSYSNRFKKVLPEVLDVPGFTGIRIHAGNTAADTSGCIIIGNKRWEKGVWDSRAAMRKLQHMIEMAESTGVSVLLTVASEK